MAKYDHMNNSLISMIFDLWEVQLQWNSNSKINTKAIVVFVVLLIVCFIYLLIGWLVGWLDDIIKMIINISIEWCVPVHYAGQIHINNRYVIRKKINIPGEIVVGLCCKGTYWWGGAASEWQVKPFLMWVARTCTLDKMQCCSSYG